MAISVASGQISNVLQTPGSPMCAGDGQVVFHAKAGDKGDLFSIYLNGTGATQVSNHTHGR